MNEKKEHIYIYLPLHSPELNHIQTQFNHMMIYN